MSSIFICRGLRIKAIITLGIAILGLVGACNKSRPNSQESPKEVTPETIREEIIPKAGAATTYGIILSLANTQKFINYYDTVQLTQDQASLKHFALWPLKAPCCDNNSMAVCCCPCNLAKSVWGLSKYLIVEKGFDTLQVRDAALQWLRFIRSDYYIYEALEDEGVNPTRYGLEHVESCYEGLCEMPFSDKGCGGMDQLKM
jgi:hypothetical protein